MTSKSPSPLELVPLQPAAFLISAEALELQTSSAKTGVKLRVVMPIRLANIKVNSLMSVDFMNLLCNGCLINI